MIFCFCRILVTLCKRVVLFWFSVLMGQSLRVSWVTNLVNECRDEADNELVMFDML